MTTKKEVTCANDECKKLFMKAIGEINRAEKLCKRHFCCRGCSASTRNRESADQTREILKVRNANQKGVNNRNYKHGKFVKP